MGMQILIKAGRQKGEGKLIAYFARGLKSARGTSDTTNLHVHYGPNKRRLAAIAASFV